MKLMAMLGTVLLTLSPIMATSIDYMAVDRFQDRYISTYGGYCPTWLWFFCGD